MSVAPNSCRQQPGHCGCLQEIATCESEATKKGVQAANSQKQVGKLRKELEKSVKEKEKLVAQQEKTMEVRGSSSYIWMVGE